MAIFLAAVLLLLLHAQDARPLPDPGTFYAAVRENLGRAQQVTHWYAYKERRTDLHTNPFGRIGTAGTRVIEVYPSANPELTYRRLVERNGVPVGAEERAEQDRAYRRHVADVEQRADRRTADDRRRRAEEDATARQRANAMIDEVKGLAVIRGYRGMPKGDRKALAAAVSAFSQIAFIDGVTEAEINPLIVRREGEGVVAVDGLIVRR